MKNLVFFALLVAVVARACVLPRVDGVEYISGEYMVVVPNELVAAKFEGLKSWVLSAIDADSKIFDFYQIGKLRAFGGRFSDRFLNKLCRRPEIEFIEPASYVELYDQRRAQYQRNATWGIDRVSQRNLPLDTIYGYPDSAGEGVNVYVVDTGIRLTHSEFEGRAVWGVTTPDDTSNTDENGHGTHVAGTIGGLEFGIAKRATLIAVKVFADRGITTVFKITQGLDWVGEAHTNGTNKKSVVNMSLGSPLRNGIIDRATEALIELGVHVVVAAGNSDKDACRASPARVPGAVTVGATDRTDLLASFSNIGECVDVFAPGVDITSAAHTADGQFVTFSGTSMASPHGAGVAALLLADADYTPAELHSKIIEISTKDVISGLDELSANRLLFNGVEQK